MVTGMGGPVRPGGHIRTGRVAGLFGGLASMVGILLTPLPLTVAQHRLLGLLALCVVFWVTRALPVPVTSLLALGLATLLGIASAADVFGAFSSPTLFLLISAFILTQAMRKHGLARRMALWVLTRRAVGGSTRRIVVAFGALATLAASVVENAAVVAMLVPVALGVIDALDDDLRRQAGVPARSRLRFATALMLITSYGATAGVLLTPFGPQTNLGWRFVRERFGLAGFDAGTWMLLAAPIVAVLFVVLCLVVLAVNRPEARRIPGARAEFQAQRAALGPLSQGEINTAIAFTTAVVLWLVPPIAEAILGEDARLYIGLLDRLGPSTVAVLATVLLFVLPVSRRKGYTLRWRDTLGMDWGPVLLMGGGLALARLMATTGLVDVVGRALAGAVGGLGPFWLLAISGALAMLFSELTSNVVSVNVLVPIIAGVAAQAAGDPVPATLTATFASLYGFMLPISTSANVIVYGTGQVPLLRMVRTGVLVDLTGISVIVVGMWFMLRLVHLG